MEHRVSISILITSPIIISVSYTLKYLYFSVYISAVASVIFGAIGLAGHNLSGSHYLALPRFYSLLKFLAIGAFIGYQCSVLVNFDKSTMMIFKCIMSLSTIIIVTILSILPMNTNLVKRFSYVFSLSPATECRVWMDALSTILASEALGIMQSIYLRFVYTIATWAYENFYLVSLACSVIGVFLYIFSRQITAIILKKQKLERYTY